MPSEPTYFYDHQLESYIKQFLRIFRELYVKDGNSGYKQVNVTYASKNRMCSLINSERSRWTSASLPIITTHIGKLEFQRDKTVSEMHIDPIVYKTDEDDIGYERTIGPAYKVQMSVDVLADSQDEMMQILEQIMLVFNPTLVIQKSEDMHDANYLTEIELTGISEGDSVPIGNDNPLNSYTLDFEFNVRLNYPIKVKNTIKKLVAGVLEDHDDSDSGIFEE